MSQPPSRRDILGPPPWDVSDLASIVRHHGSAIGQVEPGLLGGRWNTPRPMRGVGMPQLVGDGGGDSDAADLAFEYNDTSTATTAGTITFRLTYEPVEESLHVRLNELNVSAAYPTPPLPPRPARASLGHRESCGSFGSLRRTRGGTSA